MPRDERKRSLSPSISTSPSGKASSREEERKSRKSRSHKADERGNSGLSEGKKRRREEDERKSRRGSEESHKKSRDDREEKKRKKKEKKSKEKLKHRSSGSKDIESFQEISKDDYFSKNNEFSTWLKEEKGKFFSELTSEAARELFLSFVKKWNRQKLDRRYYEGIARGPRTAHAWKIKR